MLTPGGVPNIGAASGRPGEAGRRAAAARNAAAQIDTLITGRVGYVRATSTKPAAANMALVPV